MLKEILEKMKSTDSKYTPKKVPFDTFNEIVTRGKFEGIVLMGAGGSLDEWITGVTDILKEKDIVTTGDPQDSFMGAYELTTTGGRTDLALVFSNKKKQIKIGKLAQWRLKFGDTSWISDYVVNYADQHEG